MDLNERILQLQELPARCTVLIQAHGQIVEVKKRTNPGTKKVTYDIDGECRHQLLHAARKLTYWRMWYSIWTH